jgi:hypothetical protein
MVVCVMCVILFVACYFIVLYCPVAHCSTLPPGINPFAVNNNNNNNIAIRASLLTSGSGLLKQKYVGPATE